MLRTGIIEAEDEYLDYIEEEPKNGGAPKRLVIFLHGYGADKYNLIDYYKDFRDLLPDAQFISINAPYPCEAGVGFQWFSLSTMDFNYIRKEIRSNYNIVNDFIEQQSKRLNVPYENIALVGFSQGSMMSIYASLRNEHKLAGVVAFSGMVPDSVGNLQAELKTKQNIILIHGDEDFVVPYDYFVNGETLLKSLDIPVETYTCYGLTHAIDHNGIERARVFLAKVFNA